MGAFDTYKAELKLTVLCPTCGEGRSPSDSGTCGICDGQLPSEHVEAVRAAIRERRQVFKGRLNRLEKRMNEAAIEASTFATRGAPLAPQEHLNRVLRPFIARLSTRSTTVTQLLADTSWDERADERIRAFSKLVRLLEDALASVSDFRKIMPPVEWRAAHRELAHAALEQVRGQIRFTLAIIAPDATTALRQQEAGRQSLAKGARHAARAEAIIDRLNGNPDVEPFQADGSIDMAALAWTGVGREATSITDAAEIVRSAYRDIPNMSDLPDHYAVLLLSTLASAWVVDHELLVGRAQQFRAVLDRAGDPVSWLREPELLINRLQRGLDRITAETERLGREWRHNLPRRHVMNSLTEAYRQLIEGALRDLGGIILVAARAHRGDDNATYEHAVVDGIKAGEVVDELGRIGAPRGTLDMLYRNASAHADIEVTNSGIVANERLIKDGRVTKSTTTALSDDEFYEELVALQEMLLALQLALLPWVYVDCRLNAAMAAARPSPDQMARVLALLGGMAGLSDVMVSAVSDHLIVAADLLDSERDRREKEILSLVPAAFGATSEVNRVTLDIAGLKPVPFAREEFASLDSEDSLHNLPLLGLTSAKWLVQSGFHWTQWDEATYVTLPLAILHIQCMTLAASTPQSTENIDRAVASLRLVLTRLDEALPTEQRSVLTRRALAHANVLVTSFADLAKARRKPWPSVNTLRLAQSAEATLAPMYDIQEEAKALRDGG